MDNVTTRLLNVGQEVTLVYKQVLQIWEGWDFMRAFVSEKKSLEKDFETLEKIRANL